MRVCYTLSVWAVHLTIHAQHATQMFFWFVCFFAHVNPTFLEFKLSLTTI